MMDFLKRGKKTTIHNQKLINHDYYSSKSKCNYENICCDDHKHEIIEHHKRFFIETKVKDILNLEYTANTQEAQDVIDKSLDNIYSTEYNKGYSVCSIADFLVDIYLWQETYYQNRLELFLIFNPEFELPRPRIDDDLIGLKYGYYDIRFKNINDELKMLFRLDYATNYVLHCAVERYVEFLITHTHNIIKGSKLIMTLDDNNDLTMQEQVALDGNRKEDVEADLDNIINSNTRDALYLHNRKIEYLQRPEGSYGNDLKEEAEILEKQIAMALRTPVTTLFGTSATGLNATGEMDIENYNMELISIAKKYVKPILLKSCKLILNNENITIDINKKML